MTIPTKDKNENDLKILLGENHLQENEAQTPQAIALAKLHPFHEHPYKVEDNDEMAELCERSAHTEFCHLSLFARQRTGNMKLFPVTGGYLLAAGWDLKKSLRSYNR